MNLVFFNKNYSEPSDRPGPEEPSGAIPHNFTGKILNSTRLPKSKLQKRLHEKQKSEDLNYHKRRKTEYFEGERAEEQMVVGWKLNQILRTEEKMGVGQK